MKKRGIIDRVLLYSRKIPSKQLMIVLSIIVGFLVGMLAVIMKNAVYIVRKLLNGGFDVEYFNYWYVV